VMSSLSSIGSFADFQCRLIFELSDPFASRFR
jgi:hypothetical protein